MHTHLYIIVLLLPFLLPAAEEQERSRSTSPETEQIIAQALTEIDNYTKDKNNNSHTTILTATCHGNGYCVPYGLYVNSFQESVQLRKELTTFEKKHGPGKCIVHILFESEVKERNQEIKAIQQELTTLQTNHTNGKCVSKDFHEQTLKTLSQTIKEPINATTKQLIITAGVTALAISFIMHSRYHAGNFSWLDTVLPWNYLNL